MSEQKKMEMTLRKSLDEVDKTRRRQIIGAAIFLLLFLVQLASIFATLRRVGASAGDEVVLTVRADVIFMVYTVGFCVFGVSIFITRMTSKILKAIELSSKP